MVFKKFHFWNMTKSTKLYLDIDGVLIGKGGTADIDVCLAKYTKEFFGFALQYFDCYWLTTHSKDGNSDSVINYLRQFCDDDTLGLAKQLKATAWNTAKTEAIDLKSDFYWIDDSPLRFEIDVLKANDCLDRWLAVDTRARPEDLRRAITFLKACGQKLPFRK